MYCPSEGKVQGRVGFRPSVIQRLRQHPRTSFLPLPSLAFISFPGRFLCGAKMVAQLRVEAWENENASVLESRGKSPGILGSDWPILVVVEW